MKAKKAFTFGCLCEERSDEAIQRISGRVKQSELGKRGRSECLRSKTNDKPERKGNPRPYFFKWIATLPLVARNDRMRAFTLAEVLITLTIIGVIAAITIPNLMQKWQKEATVTKVKKAYNSVTRMANNIKQSTNCDDFECTGIYNVQTNDNYAELQKKFIDLAQIKNTKTYSTSWRLPLVLYCEKRGCNDRSGYFANFFTTQDGLVYYVTFPDGAKNKGILVEVITEPSQTVLKKGGDYDRKLIIGRNVFYFIINNDFKVSPYESPKTCNESSYGRGCAAKIIADGWKMDY